MITKDENNIIEIQIDTLKADNQSIVFVATPEQFNSLPEVLIVVPTLEEAHDFIELDRIQRDLGF